MRSHTDEVVESGSEVVSSTTLLLGGCGNDDWLEDIVVRSTPVVPVKQGNKFRQNKKHGPRMKNTRFRQHEQDDTRKQRPQWGFWQSGIEEEAQRRRKSSVGRWLANHAERMVHRLGCSYNFKVYSIAIDYIGGETGLETRCWYLLHIWTGGSYG